MCKLILVAWLTIRIAWPPDVAPERATHFAVTVPISVEQEVPCLESPEQGLRFAETETTTSH